MKKETGFFRTPLIVIAALLLLVIIVILASWLAPDKFVGIAMYVVSSLIYLLIFIFVLGILRSLQIRLIDKLADSISNGLTRVLSGFERKYLEYLTYKHRYVDTRGLTVSGEYNLSLDQIYTETSIKPEFPPKTETSLNIWTYLSSYQNNKVGHRLVILGSPGSGKTTLLKHITLALSDKQSKLVSSQFIRRIIPILLPLRDCVTLIQDNPDLSLAEAMTPSVGQLTKIIPTGWLEHKLEDGRCVIMLDALDEVTEPSIRTNLTVWIQKLMATYPRNHFIITSRPHEYRNNPLTGVDILEIQPFSREQTESFFKKWYLANEIARTGKDDFGIKSLANESARDLIQRLRSQPAIAALATNPLVATMIATVHSYKAMLPARRVELYQDIFDVLLRRWQNALHEPSLNRGQIQIILKMIAWKMIEKHSDTISKQEIAQEIKSTLVSMGVENLSIDLFLCGVENSTGILLETYIDHYQFAQRSFQEYLAASHVLSDKMLESQLIEQTGDIRWAETIRLYASLTDATRLVETSLEKGNFALAFDCIQEALVIKPNIRASVENILSSSIESDQPELRAIASKAILSSRLRWTTRLNSNTSIDNTLITNIEYQLFLDEMSSNGKYYYPDHWKNDTFPKGMGNQAVTGVRSEDASRFCEWLTARDMWSAKYRVVTIDEAKSTPVQASIESDAYWVVSQDEAFLFSQSSEIVEVALERKKVLEQLEEDLAVLFSLWSAVEDRERRIPSTAEILARTPVPSSYSGTSVERRELPKQNLLAHELYERRIILSIYEQNANAFAVNLNALLDANFTFKESRGDFTKWLSATPSYKVNNFFDRLPSITQYLEDNATQAIVSDASNSLLYNIVSVLKFLHRRTWRGIAIRSFAKQEQSSKFLTWYIRMSIATLAVIESRYAAFGSKNIAEDKMASRDFFGTLEEILAYLTYLERLTIGEIKPIGGIRIAKVEHR